MNGRGEILVKTFLFAVIFDSKDVIQLVDASGFGLERNFALLLKIKNYQPNYNFLPSLQNAILLKELGKKLN